MRAFPAATLSWDVDEKRQAIIDSWPEDVDDTAARRDWGFAPAFDFASAFDDYLLPDDPGALPMTEPPRVLAGAGLLVAVAGALGCGAATDRAPTQTAPPAAGGPER